MLRGDNAHGVMELSALQGTAEARGGVSIRYAAPRAGGRHLSV